MATADEYAQWIVKNADKKGTPEFDIVAKAYQASKAPADPATTTIGQDIKQGAGNLVAGAVRGAGSIGKTILSPIDALARAVNGGKPINVGGYDIAGQDRGAGMDAGLQTMGAQPDSLMYQGGKLAGEIAGTAGAGGAVANGLVRIAPRLATAAPALIDAVRTGGMSANGATGLAGLAARTAGGAITGATSAGLVDPESAGMGALIGGALPGVAQVAGKATNALGKIIRGPEQSSDTLNAVKAAIYAGYVVPPTQAKPTLVNRLLEGVSGKITTAQNASAKNADVTNALAAKAIGLPENVKLTPDVLNDVRKTAASAYRDVAELPIKPAQQADALMNTPAQPEIDPNKIVFDLRKARNDATAWFNSYGRTADPESLAKAQAAKSKATELESTLEGYAKELGRDDLVSNMVNARQLIAKTYSVEKALNGTSGNVDARVLAKQLAKGKPLSGELLQAAQFAARFPKAAQTVEGMGSLPQTSPLDWATFGGIGAATSNPLALLGVAARPAARATVLSGPVQRRLSTPQGQNQLMQFLAQPENQQLLYKAAPVAVTSR